MIQERLTITDNMTARLHAKCRQRIDVAIAMWCARHIPPLRERAVRYAQPRVRLGEVVATMTNHNIVPSSAISAVRDFLIGLNGEDAFIRQALGTDNTPPASGDTALGNETAAAGLARKDADAKTAQGANVARLGPTVWTNMSGGTVLVEEEGIFNTNGSMLARGLVSFGMDPGFSLTVTHDVTIGTV